jgi:hypothetical protein
VPRKIKQYKPIKFGDGPDPGNHRNKMTRSGITGYGECRPLSHADMQALDRLVGKAAHAYEALTSMAPGPAQGGLNLRVTDMKVFGVSVTPDSDRPYVFLKIETNQGLVGWGEATLEGKAGAAMSCVQDFRDFIVGKDPLQVEHHWESMYVHSFYRADSVIGSAIPGIDQALWDIRGKALGVLFNSFLPGRTMTAVSAAITMPRMQEQMKTSPSCARQLFRPMCPASK